jgi:pyruvate/2-oxoglutarate dehydrogenase complex dihydrolipoamide acyltransferase (E2) component
MKAFRRALIIPAIAALTVIASGGSASAQTSIQITVTPVRTDGGWIYWLAFLSLALAVLLVIFLIAAYMRYAPRFAKDEDEAKVVRADRVLPGHAPPRRMVDVTKAVPVVAAPPPVVVAAAPAAAASAAAAATPVAAAAAPVAAAPAAQTATPIATAAAPAEAAAPAAAPAPAEHADVSLDQEVFDKTLADLLATGTDRRIAEGKAKRAAMIAARKKAAGEG